MTPSDNNDTPDRDEFFEQYSIGVGGACARFTPAAGYWCSANVSIAGGGDDGAGETQELALAQRKVAAALFERGVVALG